MSIMNFLTNKFSKDEDFKRAEKEMKIQRILEQRQKNSNEREFERFLEEKRQEQIKQKLDEFRKERQGEFMKPTILNQENIFSKGDNLFKGKGTMLQMKDTMHGDNMFFK